MVKRDVPFQKHSASLVTLWWDGPVIASLMRSMEGLTCGRNAMELRFLLVRSLGAAAEAKDVRLFSYVVLRDYGFAPNPFYGVCTLATCKPKIRGVATVGDWIVGLSSVARRRPRRLVYVMQVAEAIAFDDYWMDPRFQSKRPNLRGSLKQAFGDNIYSRTPDGDWRQEDSHHSHADGRENKANTRLDTSADRVLVGEEFAYWGGAGPLRPERIDGYDGRILDVGYGHRSRFPPGLVEAFVQWFRNLRATGYIGEPEKW